LAPGGCLFGVLVRVGTFDLCSRKFFFTEGILAWLHARCAVFLWRFFPVPVGNGGMVEFEFQNYFFVGNVGRAIYFDSGNVVITILV